MLRESSPKRRKSALRIRRVVPHIVTVDYGPYVRQRASWAGRLDGRAEWRSEMSVYVSVARRAWAVVVILSACLATSARAASAAFAAAVASDGPFAHYRFGEATSPADGAAWRDATIAARDGQYRGTGTARAAGFGLDSDASVVFGGNAYASSSAVGEFGASLGQSTFEFLFKTNAVNATGGMTLFGAFNRIDGTDPTGNVAASVDLNLSASGGTSNGSTRLFIRGADGRSVSGVIVNPLLRDGQFHHLAFTYDDRNAGGVGDLIRAYVDGVPQAVAEVNVNSAGVPATYGNFEFAPGFAARQNRNASGAIYDLRADITLDEAALYTVALSPANVVSHAAALLGAATTPEPSSLALLGFAVFARRRRAVAL